MIFSESSYYIYVIIWQKAQPHQNGNRNDQWNDVRQRVTRLLGSSAPIEVRPGDRPSGRVQAEVVEDLRRHLRFGDEGDEA